MTTQREQPQQEKPKDFNPFRQVRPSIALHCIRHAESANNEVYRDAKFLFRAGREDFDEEGCDTYIATHRRADPGLSTKGIQQAQVLADYLVPHLQNQASHPVRVICSPMKRTILTVRPTLEKLYQRQKENGNGKTAAVHVMIVAFYHETEGCHLRGVPEEGLTPGEIRDMLRSCVDDPMNDIEFVGFPADDRGWYANGTGPETRADAEIRAAKYCLWLTEYLDQQLLQQDHDLFDAGVLIDGEDQEDEHDRHARRIRRRRTVLVIGHGDFMSTVLKRIVSGFGHTVEAVGMPHRSAFTHYNTGITSLEGFGNGRFLVMSTNATPHIPPQRYAELQSGGTLRDGWSFLVPPVLEPEVEVIFPDDDLQYHIREQATALKALFSSSSDVAFNGTLSSASEQSPLQVEEDNVQKNETHFIVKRGMQVVGVATFSEESGQLTDVAIRPTAAGATAYTNNPGRNSESNVAETLIEAVKKHARKMGRSSSLVVHPKSAENKKLFESLGFAELDNDSGDEFNDRETKKSTMQAPL
jgi:broad specificity phosphatase PhoE/N-acetylglutamate synthase-like GNAT family acetyltransferase